VIASLSARLFVAVTLLLLVFFGLTIFILDLAFRDAVERGIRDRLEVQLYGLLGAVEVGEDGAVTMPEDLPEARYATPGSGLFGEITRPDGERVWRSASLVGSGLPPGSALGPGESRFELVRTIDGEPVFAFAMRVDFDAGASTQPLVFSVAEDLAPFEDEVGHFRGRLFGWFALLTIALLAVQGLVMRTLLQPLRRVEREIAEVEAGQRATLGGGYPTELRGVTENLNALIGSERGRLDRYRTTLGNLAHSLKTPLAVMRTTLQRDRDASVLSDQVERMHEIVSYQLQRAAAWGGGTTLGSARKDVARVVAEVGDALKKVYAEKRVVFSADVAHEAHYQGEEGDLMEIVGNLLDNAFKWCRSRVVVHATPLQASGQRRQGLRLVVEDDGPGIDERDRARVLERGVRADERTPGHGIGLAVVADIVRLHGGELAIGRSRLGGASVELRIPPA
jgi:two-component system sensor histidine kinase PhoQ